MHRPAVKKGFAKIALLSLATVFAGCQMRGGDPLTAGEQKMVSDIFGSSLDVTVVKKELTPKDLKNAITGGPLAASVNDGRHVQYYQTSSFASDFAAPDTYVGNAALFAHEMTHIWQFQTQQRYTLCKTGQDKTYQYTLSPNLKFADYCMEQQASIIQDYMARFHHPLRVGMAFHTNGVSAEIEKQLRDVVEAQFPNAVAGRLANDKRPLPPPDSPAAIPTYSPLPPYIPNGIPSGGIGRMFGG